MLIFLEAHLVESILVEVGQVPSTRALADRIKQERERVPSVTEQQITPRHLLKVIQDFEDRIPKCKHVARRAQLCIGNSHGDRASQKVCARCGCCVGYSTSLLPSHPIRLSSLNTMGRRRDHQLLGWWCVLKPPKPASSATSCMFDREIV